jgi:hypothetical protein
MAITVSTGPPFDDRQEALLLRANALSSPSNIGPTEPSQAVPLVPIRAKVRVATARVPVQVLLPPSSFNL